MYFIDVNGLINVLTQTLKTHQQEQKKLQEAYKNTELLLGQSVKSVHCCFDYQLSLNMDKINKVSIFMWNCCCTFLMYLYLYLCMCEESRRHGPNARSGWRAHIVETR